MQVLTIKEMVVQRVPHLVLVQVVQLQQRLFLIKMTIITLVVAVVLVLATMVVAVVAVVPLLIQAIEALLEVMAVSDMEVLAEGLQVTRHLHNNIMVAAVVPVLVAQAM